GFTLGKTTLPDRSSWTSPRAICSGRSFSCTPSRRNRTLSKSSTRQARCATCSRWSWLNRQPGTTECIQSTRWITSIPISFTARLAASTRTSVWSRLASTHVLPLCWSTKNTSSAKASPALSCCLATTPLPASLSIGIASCALQRNLLLKRS
ncbi:hypothetical protein LPJ57_007912, partial [Coemansia sp. RSA 486]